MSMWMTALKAVPWGDVIAATPSVAQGARKLFKRPVVEQAAEATPRHAVSPTIVEALQNALERLQAQQKASAVAVETLVEQNRQLLDTVSSLRVRCQLLIWFSTGLALTLLCLMGWVIWQIWV